MDILVDERGKGYVILFQLDEADLRCALVHPEVMIGSDGSSLAVDGELGRGKPHPRSYGTFPACSRATCGRSRSCRSKRRCTR